MENCRLQNIESVSGFRLFTSQNCKRHLLEAFEKPNKLSHRLYLSVNKAHNFV